jgi:hypothetical protein
MKQTAVDYLFQELWDRPKDKMVWYYIFEKAKQMEREQIEKAFKSGAFYDGYELQSKQYYWEEYENKL